MFKGLRTKIESEQKGLSVSSSNSQSALSTSNKDLNQTPEGTSRDESPEACSAPTAEKSTRESILSGCIDSISINNHSATLISQNDLLTTRKLDLLELSNTSEYNSMKELQKEVFGLNKKLQDAIREKEDSNEQNSQLYQLIEKLRRQLDLEKKNNSNLKAKLTDLGNSHKPASFGQTRNSEPVTSKNITLPSPTTFTIDSLACDDIEALKSRILELQNELSEKNRQLRIRQQNLNDLKKALQSEIAEHKHTKELLTKIKEQV